MIEPREDAYIHAWAISVLASRTMWWNAANFLIAALSLSDVTALIPVRLLPLQVAIVALVNLWLRTTTTRPVAFIAPGTTKVIAVPKIDPPAPPVVGD
jgi:hypothetical protein